MKSITYSGSHTASPTPITFHASPLHLRLPRMQLRRSTRTRILHRLDLRRPVPLERLHLEHMMPGLQRPIVPPDHPCRLQGVGWRGIESLDESALVQACAPSNQILMPSSIQFSHPCVSFTNPNRNYSAMIGISPKKRCAWGCTPPRTPFFGESSIGA